MLNSFGKRFAVLCSIRFLLLCKSESKRFAIVSFPALFGLNSRDPHIDTNLPTQRPTSCPSAISNEPYIISAAPPNIVNNTKSEDSSFDLEGSSIGVQTQTTTLAENATISGNVTSIPIDSVKDEGLLDVNFDNDALFLSSQNSSIPSDALVDLGTQESQHPSISNDGNTSSQSFSNQFDSSLSSEYKINELLQKYKGRLVLCRSALFPHSNIFLCGTLHVAQTSVDMVKEVIRSVCPEFVVLELCEGRIENLVEYEAPTNLTLSDVLRSSVSERSLKTFGMGLLTWMQLKAASVMGSKLGGELSTAAKEAHKIGATIILGDRLYSVTIQRVFDRLRFVEKMKMVFVVIWEVITMSFFKIKEYIKKTENDSEFIKGELERFAKHMPSFAEVIISERDEYLAQSLHEVAQIAHSRQRQLSNSNRNSNSEWKSSNIVAVVGAGHLAGIQRHLAVGKIPLSRIQDISKSSKQLSTWPGEGILHVVNGDILFSNNQNTIV